MLGNEYIEDLMSNRWNPFTSYKIGTAVFHKDIVYVCQENHTSNDSVDPEHHIYWHAVTRLLDTDYVYWLSVDTSTDLYILPSTNVMNKCHNKVGIKYNDVVKFVEIIEDPIVDAKSIAYEKSLCWDRK